MVKENVPLLEMVEEERADTLNGEVVLIEKEPSKGGVPTRLSVPFKQRPMPVLAGFEIPVVPSRLSRVSKYCPSLPAMTKPHWSVRREEPHVRTRPRSLIVAMRLTMCK